MTREELMEYLRLVPQAVQDPAFYQTMLTGLAPDQAAAQDLSTGNQLVKMGAGALQGAANIGNAFGSLVDPLAQFMENRFGTVTANGLFPTVAEARAARDQAKSNYDAIYGGSIPAAIGKDIGLETLGAPVLRAGGAALKAIPGAENLLARMMSGNLAGRVAGNALTGAGAGAGYAALENGSLDPTQLATSAAFGAGFGGLQGVRPGTTVPPRVDVAGKPTPAGLPPPTGIQRVTQKFEGAPKAAPADQWLGYFRGAQARGLLTKEEQQDIGLDQWLAQKQAAGEPVTREDVAVYVEANVPKVKVVTPSGGGDMHLISQVTDDNLDEFYEQYAMGEPSVTEEVRRRLGRDLRGEELEGEISDDIHRVLYGMAEDKSFGDVENQRVNDQRYKDYQLPGGENYHERVITIPTQANKVEGGDFSSYTKAPAVYQSSHWDEPNVLAHWRANERPIGNQPSYHIEEIQSDWHQEGRTKGYALTEAEKKRVKEIQSRMGDESVNPQTGELEPELAVAAGVITPEEAELYQRDLRPHVGGRREELVPQAPFKKSWEQLTVKKALKEAVDRGMTRVSWTPGELQSTATGYEKNIKGNDERYNKRLVNIVNDLGKKYGVKVQFKEGSLEAMSSKKAEGRSAKIPYIDLTPEMVQAIKNGEFTLY